MLGLKDLIAVMDRWDTWRQVRETPAALAALGARVAALEEKLGGKWPADVCPHCGERAMRQTLSVAPVEGAKVRQEWQCQACQYGLVRLV